MNDPPARPGTHRFGRRRCLTATGGAATLALLAACVGVNTSTPTPARAAARAVPTTAPTAQAVPTTGPTPVPPAGTAVMTGSDRLRPLEIRGVERGPAEGGAERLALHTDAGTIACRLHDAGGNDAGVLWVFGAGGGLGGPVGGLYPRLARRLIDDRIASLEVVYRRPRDLAACVADVLTGIGYLGTLGRARIALVGHSFGGAVVITAGAASAAMIAVAVLSSQSRGTEPADRLSPRPLLLTHGSADEILPDRSSRDIYARAREPKRLVLYPGCRHGLDECRDEVDRDLLGWLREVVTRPA